MPWQVWRGCWWDKQEGREQEEKIHRRNWGALLQGKTSHSENASFPLRMRHCKQLCNLSLHPQAQLRPTSRHGPAL